MAFATSSTIGANLNSQDTTQLFALNTKVLGSNDSEWHYVIATQALATGQWCYIQFQGTADVLTTAFLGGAGVLGTTGNMDLGVAQYSISGGAYGWVLKRGSNAYLLCSGTCTPGVCLGWTPSGTLVTGLNVGISLTAFGVMITTSASTATASVATGLVAYPRAAGNNGAAQL